MKKKWNKAEGKFSKKQPQGEIGECSKHNQTTGVANMPDYQEDAWFIFAASKGSKG